MINFPGKTDRTIKDPAILNNFRAINQEKASVVEHLVEVCYEENLADSHAQERKIIRLS